MYYIEKRHAWEHARKAFMFMLASSKPVTSSLLIAAIAQDVNTTNIQLPPRDLNAQDTFQFSHGSAGEYLKNSFSTGMCNLYLAKQSMIVLSDTSYCEKALDPQNGLIAVRPLVIHCLFSWMLFVRSLGNKATSDPQILSLLQRFFLPRKSRSGYTLWHEMCRKTVHEVMDIGSVFEEHWCWLSDVLRSQSSPVFLLGAFGLSSVIEKIGKKSNWEWNEVNDDGETCFSLAVKYRHIHTIRTFLDRGMPVRPCDFSMVLRDKDHHMDIALLICRAPHIALGKLLNTETLIAAAWNFAYRGRILRQLVCHWPPTVPIEISKELVWAFAIHYDIKFDKSTKYLEALVRNNKILINEETLPIIAAEWSSSIMGIVLSRSPKLASRISSKLLFAAVKNNADGLRMLEVLLRHSHKVIHMTLGQKLLTRATRNELWGDSLVELFLCVNKKICVTGIDLVTASTVEKHEKALLTLRALLKKCNHDVITRHVLQNIINNTKDWSDQSVECLEKMIWKSKGFNYKGAELIWADVEGKSGHTACEQLHDIRTKRGECLNTSSLLKRSYRIGKCRVYIPKVHM
ncbi:hypothetical protein BDV27DRAFT_124897 [Aspergillus caelatus]|uniref:Ankyrin repeat-containing domain protein n=1 Tax=Aspergillus caelatus TaxID=61420 RepID=A0A5N7AAA4_9EURO|nr:uncharacterized protein BDV27DRAFT_124897 [Aspergillus caelatus]KAE8366752.1 hypothetical protein BDV27DRAFT_124897 [Aspergillus caelatus]